MKRQIVVLWDEVGRILFLDANQGKIIASQYFGGYKPSVFKWENHKVYIAYDNTYALRVYDLEPIALNQAVRYLTYVDLTGHTNTITGVHQLSDGKYVTASGDLSCRIWSETGKTIQYVREHRTWIIGLLKLPDDQCVSYSKDRTLVRFNADGTVLTRYQGHRGKLVGAAYVAASNQLLAWDEDGEFIYWALDGKIVKRITTPTGIKASATYEHEGE